MKTPLLCVADEATFWPALRWTDFHGMPHRERTVVVVPIVGMADWGLGQALDTEEVLLTRILREASLRRGDLPLLVIPPLRFVLGPDPGCVFPVSPPVACALIEETVLSIKRSGFTKVVLFNSSPWNEELCDAVARDLRIEHALQMFCINLSALGLDLHPTRSRSRRDIASLAAALGGAALGSGPEGTALPEVLFEAAADRLAGFLREIHGRPPLPDGGAILPVPAR